MLAVDNLVNSLDMDQALISIKSVWHWWFSWKIFFLKEFNFEKKQKQQEIVHNKKKRADFPSLQRVKKPKNKTCWMNIQ